MTVGMSQALMSLVHSSVLRTGIASSDEYGGGAENGLNDGRLHGDGLFSSWLEIERTSESEV